MPDFLAKAMPWPLNLQQANASLMEKQREFQEARRQAEEARRQAEEASRLKERILSQYLPRTAPPPERHDWLFAAGAGWHG